VGWPPRCFLFFFAPLVAGLPQSENLKPVPGQRLSAEHVDAALRGLAQCGNPGNRAQRRILRTNQHRSAWHQVATFFRFFGVICLFLIRLCPFDSRVRFTVDVDHTACLAWYRTESSRKLWSKSSPSHESSIPRRGRLGSRPCPRPCTSRRGPPGARRLWSSSTVTSHF